ncbi:T9SS type A sorting domain-containing protein [Sanyastnella coralliicola]|uniref:T9SS type A sorting domain-containing protein n=1 Tax=Sanyastnella coralliicola TaxID=3069118 RepID=UPI0027B92E6B|nr:T9SS type A sorting domain-containing protein [Longitalea sp. SCSIO 12813]
MIYRFSISLVFLLVVCSLRAQVDNLVPNSSFEERDECDPNYGELDDAPPWFSATMATPDVYHRCTVVLDDDCPYPENQTLDPWLFGVPVSAFGCQEPRSGDGYAGFLPYSPGPQAWNDWSEYLAVELQDVLNEGEVYYIRFYLSLAERSSKATSAIQVLLVDSLLSQYSGLNSTIPVAASLSNTPSNFIDEKDDWTLLQWEYVAQGGERYLYIGNFIPNSETPTINAIPSDVIDENHFDDDAYYYIDDVYIGQTPVSVSEDIVERVRVFPNPFQSSLTVNGFGAETFQIYDAKGVVVLEGDLINSKFDNRINTANLDVGFYLIVIYFENNVEYIERILKW